MLGKRMISPNTIFGDINKMGDQETSAWEGCLSLPVRSLPDEEGIHRNLELEAEGWEKRYLAETDRAKEAVAMYSSLGYEVKEHKIQPDEFNFACGECPSVVCRTYVMIYTRKKVASKG